MHHYDNHIDFYPDNHWHRYWHNDTEAAAVPRPGEPCCGPGEKEDCVCVTSGDVELWNQVSAISELSGFDWDALSGVSGLTTSANLWNSAFLTVYNNSAIWNEINNLSGIEDASGFWQKASEIVSANSGKWNSAYNSIRDIDELSANVETLSSLFAKQVKLYFSNTMSGDGTQATPYGVKNYNEFTNLVNNLNTDISNLYKEENGQKVQNWISLDATSEENGINPYIKSLFSAVAVKDNDQDKTLIKHGDLIEWLIKHRSSGSGVNYKAGYGINISNDYEISVKDRWVYVPDITSANYQSLNEENTFYYTY